MRHARGAGQALKLAVEPARQPYICRACARQFSSTPSNAAEEPFWRQMQKNLFGSKKSAQADTSRVEQQKKRIEEAAKSGQTELETQVDRDGNVYEVARLFDKSIRQDYEPAKTWAGLERVGSEKWVRERADGGEKYSGFVALKKAQLTDEQWQKLLHHIAVEVFTIQKAGRDVLEICNARREEGNCQMTACAAITPRNGVPKLSSLGAQLEKEILENIVQASDETVPSQESLENELQQATSPEIDLTYAEGATGWMNISLQDPKIKLAFLQRIMQLSGKRVPDPKISQVKTLQDLYKAFKTKEKPAKLHLTTEYQILPQISSNIAVHSSRRTPVHKEKEIGRWKIIKDELILRNLPIFGSKYNAKDKEVETWNGFESKRGAASKASAAKGM